MDTIFNSPELPHGGDGSGSMKGAHAPHEEGKAIHAGKFFDPPNAFNSPGSTHDKEGSERPSIRSYCAEHPEYPESSAIHAKGFFNEPSPFNSPGLAYDRDIREGTKHLHIRHGDTKPTSIWPDFRFAFYNSIPSDMTQPPRDSQSIDYRADGEWHGHRMHDLHEENQANLTTASSSKSQSGSEDKLDYVPQFTEQLYRSLSLTLDKAAFKRVSSTLDDLLLAFAHRAKHHATLEVYGADRLFDTATRLQVIGSLSYRFSTVSNDGDDLSEGNYTSETPAPAIPGKQKAPVESPAYQWLLWKITSASRQYCPGHTDCHKQIIDTVRKVQAGEKVQVIEFLSSWNIVAFHAEQQYKCTADQILDQAITITGYEKNVQAATCSEYVAQTWGKDGTFLLNILKQAIRDSALTSGGLPVEPQLRHSPSCPLSILVSYQEGRFNVRASGMAYFVGEVGAILAWLAAALWSPPAESGLVFREPRASFNFCVQPYGGRMATIHIDILDRHSASLKEQGNCWMKAFRNPVVVKGYPIPHRCRPDSGLEVSVDIMAALLNADYMVDFNRRTYLKGFSTMLVVMEVVDSTVFWHMFYNPDKTYISYEDDRVPRLSNDQAATTLDPKSLGAKQHILGWCEKVSFLAGTPNANYDIGWSNLGSPPTSFAIDKITIGVGKIVSASALISLGLKDKPLYISYDDSYISTLQAMSEQHIVFYDTIEKRSWLLDGATAVLHLMRASVQHLKHDLFNNWLFDPTELREPEQKLGARRAALYVLSNRDNQQLQLWKETDECVINGTRKPATYTCFRDRVLQICRVIQQMIAHQGDMSSREGMGSRIGLPGHRHPVGFQFMDLANIKPAIHPLSANVSNSGNGWIDLAQKLHAITLFGTNFGMLMEPVGTPCDQCMVNVPHGPNLMAVTVAHLWNIIEKHGGKGIVPVEVIRGLFLDVPNLLFEPCKCSSACGQTETTLRSNTRHTRVQYFTTNIKLHRDPARHVSQLCKDGDGAILISHNKGNHLRKLETTAAQSAKFQDSAALVSRERPGRETLNGLGTTALNGSSVKASLAGPSNPYSLTVHHENDGTTSSTPAIDLSEDEGESSQARIQWDLSKLRISMDKGKERLVPIDKEKSKVM